MIRKQDAKFVTLSLVVYAVVIAGTSFLAARYLLGFPARTSMELAGILMVVSLIVYCIVMDAVAKKK